MGTNKQMDLILRIICNYGRVIRIQIYFVFLSVGQKALWANWVGNVLTNRVGFS